MNITLWEFPAADFADWQALVGSPEVASHADYMALLAAVQADQERQGREVVRVPAKLSDALQNQLDTLRRRIDRLEKIRTAKLKPAGGLTAFTWERQRKTPAKQ